MKSCPTPCLGSVLHVSAQWVTPSPVPGGSIGQSLKGSVLSNIRKLFTHQALERSKQNFVIKISSCHTPCLGSVLHVHAQWVTPSPVPGGSIGQSLEGGLLLNMRKLFMMQAVERGKQNFVTKLNHDQHLSWGLYYMSMPNRLPPARSQGAL